MAAYAVVDDGRSTLLVPACVAGHDSGLWTLPGGRVGHGEPPAQAVVRQTRRLTGLGVEVTGLRLVTADVTADVTSLPGAREPVPPEPQPLVPVPRETGVHTIRVVYSARSTGAVAAPVPGARAVPGRELTGLPLAPYAAAALGIGAGGAARADGAAVRPVPPTGGPYPARSPAPDDRPAQVQRPGAYALVVQDGQVLLTRYVRSGRWTLPGGGIDFGEQPLDAVRREVWEETGLRLHAATLLHVGSVHFTGHAPHGRLEDFHGIRIVYRGRVAPGRPRVVEVGGTTDAVAWTPLGALGDLPLTDLVGQVLGLPE